MIEVNWYNDLYRKQRIAHHLIWWFGRPGGLDVQWVFQVGSQEIKPETQNWSQLAIDE